MAVTKVERYSSSIPERYTCLVADDKPTGVPEMSILIEVQEDDSLKYYMFVQEDWHEMEMLGGI